MRLPLSFLFGLFAAGLLATAAPAQLNANPKKPIVRGKVGKALDEYVRNLDQAGGGFVGSAFVARGDKILLDQGYGIADAKKKRKMPVDALWDWASVSKQFTAAAILKLQMQQKLHVDDSIRQHFKQAPEDKQPITIRHLLNHTSGVEQNDSARGYDLSKPSGAIRMFLETPATSKPGEKWSYSNLSYWVLAALVEELSGTTFERYCIEHLFRPAGMKDACFIGSPKLKLKRVPRDDRGRGDHFAYGYKLRWGYRGSGGTIATPREMWLWDRALRGTKILNAAAKKELYRVGLQNYALGWRVLKSRNDTRYEHGGAVGKTVTYYLRGKKSKIVIALAYAYRPPVHPARTAEALLGIVRKK